MLVWQVDFYRRPQNNIPMWDLLICDATGKFKYEASCPQSQANSTWITSQFELARGSGNPDKIQVFRPQSLSLIETAARNLNIEVEPTRSTKALKQWLKEKSYPITIEQLPPVPLPDNLLGDKWRFASLKAGDLEEFRNRRIPIVEFPDFLLPLNLGLASTQLVPGIIIYGGRQSMRLARWLQESNPACLNYISGAPDGLILESGLADRWVIVTFDDNEVKAAAKSYEQRKQQCRGLHFLLVQPDDSGMTYSGFWSLQAEN
ncbi:MAG: Tab2/Atab2 family RNA-binding protein [Calothrix sp. C42_A2020_038]|nr:Tab2/Atab2 family RNA-binding protein [Calothrix sp. C42_A2020_038]